VSTASKNKFGYDFHFNLQNNQSQISSTLNWNNPEVTWKYVSCSAEQTSNYTQCEC
ncbi:unnamed protein product, partial [Lymnaea stagnalis]